MNKEYKKATKKTKNLIETLGYAFLDYMKNPKQENIDKYLKQIKKVDPRAIEMTTNPFGVVIKVNDEPVHIVIKQMGDKVTIDTE